MKNFKRIIAVMLTCIMALTLGVVTGISVSAATTDPDITIIPQDDGYEHQYAAYQIFDGELSTDKNNNLVLSNIVWGTGINSTQTTDLLTEIKAFKDLDDTTPFSAVSSADDVAKKLSDLRNKYSSDGQSLSTVIDSFSQILSKYLSSTSTTSTKSKTECVISDVDPGYYLITDISATYTTTREISTESDIHHVGSGGDVYIGYSTNRTFGEATSIALLRDATGHFYLGTEPVITVGEQFKTDFTFSQLEIETAQIPNFIKLRDALLETVNATEYDNPPVNKGKDIRYITMLEKTAPDFGTIGTYKALAPEENMPADTIEQDMVLYYNCQIDAWKARCPHP